MRYVYPPRPKGLMEPRLLSAEERKAKWIAQYKYNGNRCVIQVTPERHVTLFNRHGKILSKMPLTISMRNQILSLNLVDGQGYILDGECMHAKTSLKDTIVLYDILWAERYLHFMGQMRRLEMLANICRNPSDLLEPPLDIAFRVTDNIWMAPTFENHFVARYNFATSNEHLEGLVLRSKISTLDNSGGKEFEVTWLMRVREPGTYGHF